MKFLVDAQLPKKLSDFLKWKGYNSIHTLDLPNKNFTKDSEINQISVSESRILISKDLDFIESLLVYNKPYKLIYISAGNLTNKDLLKLFNKNLNLIIEAIECNRLIEIDSQRVIIRY